VNCSNLGQYLHTSGQPMPNGLPWGTASAKSTNYYNSVPNTGMTRSYTFSIATGTISPDGVERDTILINGAFPGPLIEANWGDMIQVTVNNDMESEGTSLHWHGMLQKKTPYMDGVPGVGQCPIPPGGSFTYTFQADLYGSSWYHSHYSAQYSAGLVGPMVIHGPSSVEYDIDLGPVLLTDWYHDSYFNLVEQVMTPASQGLPPPTSNNNLINGKMNYPCQNTTSACTPNAGISIFQFQAGKKHRLRLINAGAEGTQKFSIDGHQLQVFANDFVQIQPYTTNVITLGVGQRTDVIVDATGSSTDAVWMRSSISLPCSSNDGVSPNAVAAVYYQHANMTEVPTTNTSVTTAQLDFCGNDDLATTQPYMSLTPSAPSTTQDIVISYQANTTDPSTAYNLFYMNNSTFRADYNDPVLLEAKLGNTDFDPEWNVYNFGSNSSVRIVVYNTFAFSGHPMHLHGHNFWVLAEGFGTWDGSITNSGNPQRRDVQIVQPAASATDPAYIVLQYDQDNPGVWPFHCHIAWHVSAGLYISILEQPSKVASSNIPGVMAQTCRDWSAWTGSHVPDQIDSGL